MEAHAFSASAREAIEKAGGEARLISKARFPVEQNRRVVRDH